MKDKRPTKRFAAPARAGRPLRPQQLLILAYAAAVIVWLVYVLVGSAVMLNHKADGTMVTRTLTADDLEFESFVNYDDDEWHTAPVDEPGWYLSTDNDPHIILAGRSLAGNGGAGRRALPAARQHSIVLPGAPARPSTARPRKFLPA